MLKIIKGLSVNTKILEKIESKINAIAALSFFCGVLCTAAPITISIFYAIQKKTVVEEEIISAWVPLIIFFSFVVAACMIAKIFLTAKTIVK
jgi:hypothetical protein